MSHDPSRKHFLAKLIGLFAVIGIAPRLLGKSSAPAAPTVAGLQIQRDPRTVARQAGEN